jgi:hypothetical protein
MVSLEYILQLILPGHIHQLGSIRLRHLGETKMQPTPSFHKKAGAEPLLHYPSRLLLWRRQRILDRLSGIAALIIGECHR